MFPVLYGCKIWSLIFKRRTQAEEDTWVYERMHQETGEERMTMKSVSFVCSTYAIRMIK